MADQKTNFTPYVIAGVVGLAFVGWQQTAKNTADNVSNLPALESRISSEEEGRRKDIDDVKAQINRREIEMRAEVDKAIAILTNRILRDEAELTRLRERLDDLQQKYPALKERGGK